MKIVLWERKIKIPKAYIIIAALIMLIILVLWGWYLKVNNIDVFDVSDGNSGQSSQSEISSADYKNQTISAENGPTGGSGSAIPDTAKATGKVNINTADVESLMSLKGIGAVKANAVIAYRQQNGPFKSIEEIMNVKGIKKATFEKIKDSISVE